MLSRIYDLLLPLCGRVFRGGVTLETARLGWHGVTRSAGSWRFVGRFSWGSARASLHPRLQAIAPPGLGATVSLARLGGRGARAGFTLIELAIVVFLLGLVAAIAVPRLLPVIAFSELEGSARRVAGFGQGAMAHAALLRDRVVVRIDLKEQEIYAVHWILPEQEEAEALAAEGEPDQLAKLSQLRDQGVRSPADLQEKFLGGEDLSGILGGDDGAFDSELAGYQMDDKFNAFARQALEIRAENVKHDESLLDDVANIFGDEEIFDLDEEEPVEEELADPILRRTRLRGAVEITGVDIDGEYHSRGVPEVEFSVLGLTQKVILYLENEDDEAFTVLWDPISNRSTVHVGRVSDL